MKSNNALIAVALIGGGLFLASRARAEEASQPVPPAAALPIIPGTGGATAPTPAAAPGGGMAPSKAAVDLIRKNIGFLPLPKKEPSGAVIIGYGHKVVAGDPELWTQVAQGTKTGMTPLTIEQGEALFLNDLLKHVEVINRLVTVPLNQNQYDALAMLVFNIGVDNFALSTLLKRLNEKDYAGAGEQFLVWNKSRDAAGNLVANPTLTLRRAGERELFLTPVVEVAGVVPTAVQQAQQANLPMLVLVKHGDEIGEGHFMPDTFNDPVTKGNVYGHAQDDGTILAFDPNTGAAIAGNVIGRWK